MTILPPPSRSTASVPLYVQIAETLMEQIDSGELRAGSRLPSERELAKEVGVNRMTLRQALNILEVRGLLVRRQGDGTYVTPPKIERPANDFFPFSQGMARKGYQPGASIILFERRPADIAVAKQLDIATDAMVYHGHRLRLINDEPVMLEQFNLPAARFPNFEQWDISTQSIYALMEREYNIQISRARQTFEPVIATAYEADLLGVLVGAPLMLERRLTYDQNGQIVEYTKDFYRGDRFRFVTERAMVPDETMQLVLS
jgi:GntR family transcriptional regulator